MLEARRVDYNQAASEYAAHRRIHGGVFRELCGQGELGPRSFVLEVGCGTGNYAAALAAHTGCTAFGLDPSAGMLAQARAQPGRVGWLLGRAERLPFAVHSFDLVFSVDVIHHVADKAGFYREAARTPPRRRGVHRHRLGGHHPPARDPVRLFSRDGRD